MAPDADVTPGAGFVEWPVQPSGCRTMPNEGIQGDEWGAYVTLGRTTRTNAGSPAGQRGTGDWVSDYQEVCVMQCAETVFDILRERGGHPVTSFHGIVTGEPGDRKRSRRVREGDAGKGPKGTSPASYLGHCRCQFWSRFHQNLQLFPLPAEAVGQWARLGQTSLGCRRPRLHRISQRLCELRRPARLQAICDRLSPARLQAFFNYWITRIPCP